MGSLPSDLSDTDELAEKAAGMRHQGCNCCQSVVYTLTEDPQSLLYGGGFGGGMGTMNGVCGALAGAVMAAGIRTGGKGTGRYSRQISELFRESSGSLICRELKGVDTGTVLCPCDDCVRNAVKAFRKVFDS